MAGKRCSAFVVCSTVYHKRLNVLVIALQCSEIYCSLQNIDDKRIRPVEFIGQSSAGMGYLLVSYKIIMILQK
jgi:hypothetical protein